MHDFSTSKKSFLSSYLSSTGIFVIPRSIHRNLSFSGPFDPFYTRAVRIKRYFWPKLTLVGLQLWTFSMQNVLNLTCMKLRTSRERPKSALYLRLKIVKGRTLRAGFVKLQLVVKSEKNWRGALWGLEKISQKYFLNDIFEQCHSAEKCKRGDPLRFDIHCVAKCRNKWRGTLWCNAKSFKKLQSAEKKWGYGRILSVISRFWTSVLFFFSFWTRFWGSSCWGSKLLRFDVVEQMNKKGPHASKKTTHCRAHFLLNCAG